MPFSKSLILPFFALTLFLSACAPLQTFFLSRDLEATPETSPEEILSTPDSLQLAPVDTLATPIPLPAMETLPAPPAQEWSIRDRALAFHPRLQELQESFDHAVHSLATGDLLHCQETLDEVDAYLETVKEDSLVNGLTQLYLGSLRERIDRLQEILDEESLMQFSAPLAVADDSLLAIWYGGMPEIPSRPLRLVRNERVSKWIFYFTGKGRKTFELWMERGEIYRPLIESALDQHELPRELFYLAMIESGFSSSAKSSAGAVGPWQFIRGTGRRYGLSIDYWVDERKDFVRSTEAACQYLSHLYGIFQDWNLAMAAYNSGEFRVQATVRRSGSRDFWELKLPRQTRDYVPKMMAATIIASNLEEFGFSLPKARPFQYEDLSLKEAADLSLLSRKGNIPLKTLRKMNPQLLRWCTPPDRGEYVLHVPKGKSRPLGKTLATLSRQEQIRFRKHRVKKGETLYDIAKGYGTTVKAITRQNGIQNPRLLRAGSQIVVPIHPDIPFRPSQNGGVASAAEKMLPSLSTPLGMGKSLYTVRKGENLSVIARKLGCRVRQLQDWNRLGPSSRIYPNQVLQFLHPEGSKAPGSSPRSVKRTHVVAKGESLYRIGKKYGASVSEMRKWNPKLAARKVIHPGERLVVYTDL
jgi:membrane-bound lytic murein transglycosylase D